jgi:hypothetical protein
MSDVPTLDLMREWETRAEAAYAAMYDAASHAVKDLKDEALLCLARATEIAEALDRIEDAKRLRARSENIAAVYNSQFRYVGR